jgi:hypothetical protein
MWKIAVLLYFYGINPNNPTYISCLLCSQDLQWYTNIWQWTVKLIESWRKAENSHRRGTHIKFNQSWRRSVYSQTGLTSGTRPIVKIIAESLSQHDEKHIVPTPLSVGKGRKKKKEKCLFNIHWLLNLAYFREHCQISV